MKEPVEAVFYDGLTSRPRKALASVQEQGTLQVDVLPDGEDAQGLRILWPMEHQGMVWERSPSTLRLSFGEHPRRVVLVRDPLFIKSFAIRMRLVGRQGVYDRLLQAGRRVPVLFVLAVLTLVTTGYLWGLPWAVERLAMALPTSLDEALGETMYRTMAPALSLDSARSGMLQRFGDRLELASGFKLTYHVADEDEVNAFAMPGGHIVVYTGLLERMDDPGQLVALLAHEATHVQERHSTRAVVREMSGSVFLALIVGDAGGVAAAAAGQGDALNRLGYSRGLEAEADALGMGRMTANGVDPQGMVKLLQLLEREAQDMPEGLSFLSSHPLTTERIAAAEEKAKALGSAPSPDAELERLFEALKAGSGISPSPQ